MTPDTRLAGQDWPETGSGLPRMLYFRWTRDGLPPFLRSHVTEQLTSLGQFFDILVIDRDCDYDEVCERLRPDLCVFESGVYAGDRSIRNTATHPEIPKLGFLHADAFDSSRAAFIADMAQWNVDWYFTTSMSMAEYTPEIASRLFVWPNAIDPGVFRDYGLAKNIPVLFTGSQAWHYPWRNAISRAVTPEFVTMTMPHFGWGQSRGTERMVHGADYARLLNASVFVPTCGTVSKDVVRKHLEIPASMACLVTERTASIEAFGFEDMVSCVFATEDDVVGKLDHLLRNPDELERVTRAGHRLVAERHTIAHRDQVRQWFDLVSVHGTSMNLVQSWPGGDLTLAPEGESLSASTVVSYGRDRELISDGWAKLADGDLASAERAFQRCINYYFMPEAALGLAFARLLGGDWRGGRSWISRAISASATYGAAEPDPVQWATMVRILLCSGDVPAAVAAASAHPSMTHPEIARIRAAIDAIAGSNTSDVPHALPRASVCPVPESRIETWTAQLVSMLSACGRFDLAAGLGEPGVAAEPAAAGRRPVSRYLARRRVVSTLTRLRKGETRSSLERWVRARLSPLKRRLTSDPWSRFAGDFAKREPVSSALIVLGSDGWTRAARAVNRNLQENPAVDGVLVESDSERVADRVADLAQSGTSLVFVTRGGADVVEDSAVLRRVSSVMIEGVNDAGGGRILGELVEMRSFDVVDQRPDLAGGSVVLRRMPVGTLRKDSAR